MVKTIRDDETLYLPAPPIERRYEQHASGIDDDFPALLRSMFQWAATANANLKFYGWRALVLETEPNDYTAPIRSYHVVGLFEKMDVGDVGLDPRNMNGAPQVLFGQTVSAEELAEKQIGTKEQRF